MGIRITIERILSALLILGSAVCISCKGNQAEEEDDNEGLRTQRAENLKIIESKDGKLSYRFTTPIMEAYELDREPIRKFPQGIYVETFADSTNVVESTLVGDYAIHYIDRDLWYVQGNVVATNSKDQKLETQQLYWNKRIGKIYSNVDSKLTQNHDVIVGEGFESDEQFNDWVFRRPRGTVEMDVEATKTRETEEETDTEGDNPEGITPGDTTRRQTPATTTDTGDNETVSGEPAQDAHQEGQPAGGSAETAAPASAPAPRNPNTNRPRAGERQDDGTLAEPSASPGAESSGDVAGERRRPGNIERRRPAGQE